MATSANPLAASGINVVATDNGARYVAPASNSALELAHSLRDLTPTANQFLTEYGQQQADNFAAKAKADVIANAGEKFGDAVREGKLEPTQNPWYIQAYQREGAAVQAQKDMAKLQTDSQSWAEQNDPAAFQQKWNEAVGGIAKGYTDPDAQAGFDAVAAQTSQQVIATNTAQNVAAINAARVSNLTQLTTQALQQAASDAGGHPSPGQLWAATAAAKDQWIKTGGTQAQWDQIEVAALTGAAYNAQNTEILDAVGDQTRPGGYLGGIAQIADQASADKYRIRSNIQDEANAKLQAAKAAQAAKAFDASNWMWQTYGAGLLEGNYDVNQIIKDATAQGYDPATVGAALSVIRDPIQDSIGLMSARLTANGANPQTGKQILDLASYGRIHGYSTAYENKLGSAVLSGLVSGDDAASMLSSSVSRTEQLNSDARRDRRGGSTGLKLKNWTSLNTEGDNLAAYASATEKSAFGTNVADTDTIAGGVKQSMRAYLGAHPGDWQGAYAAGKDATNQYMTQSATKHSKTPAGAAKPAGNPRGN